MEITIGVQHIARELVLEIDRTAEAVAKDVRKALAAGEPLEITDSRGRTIIVPTERLGYVEIGTGPRPVGFHNP